ncbi:TPA: hypothetical protein ACRNR3_005661 [Pseudomonas aeruginosa]
MSSQLIGVLAASTQGDADAKSLQTGAWVAGNATQHNYLSHWHEEKKRQEVDGCKDKQLCKTGIEAKWAIISAQQDVGIVVGVGGGIGLSTAETAVGVYELVKNWRETYAALEQLATSPEFRQQFGDNYLKGLEERAAFLTQAYEDAGWQGSVTAGVEGGRFAAELVGVLTAVKGGAQITAKLPTAAKNLVNAIAESPVSGSMSSQLGAVGDLGRLGGGAKATATAGKVADEFIPPGMERPFRPVNPEFPPNKAVVDAMESPRIKGMTACDGTDCSEIASKLLAAAGGKGKVIEVRPTQRSNLNLYENGNEVPGQAYHQVYTDGRYVYGPRLSSQPIPKGDWEQHIKGMNPDGVTISDKLQGVAMNTPEIKRESSSLLELIEALGETEWRKCVNSQFVNKERGEWVVKDQSSHPPRVWFRFIQEDPAIISRLRVAIESYQGRVKWVLDEHKRVNLPGTNWGIVPSRLLEVWDLARALDLAPNQYMAKYEPEFGPIAYEDIIDLTEHVRRAFPEVTSKNPSL